MVEKKVETINLGFREVYLVPGKSAGNIKFGVLVGVGLRFQGSYLGLQSCLFV